jgi:UDP-glucose 4-epimerase
VLAGSLEEPDAADPIPVSPYAAASAGAASYGALFHALFGQAVLHARLFMVYGPGDPNEARVVPHTIRQLLAGGSPQLGRGVRPIDWIYIDDAVSGLIALGACDEIDGGSFDLGSGVMHTVREVALRIAALIGSATPIEFGARPEPERERVRSADLAGTRARLDWSPQVTLDEGLFRTIEWMREHPAKGQSAPTPR